jgi:uncharacterized protein YozE (UPF0346 family)
MTTTKRLLPFLLVMMSSCHGDPRAYSYSTEKPIESVTGKYSLTNESLSFLKSQNYNSQSSFLELRTDSTFILSNIPDIWNPFVEPKGAFESAYGRWKIRKSQDWWTVELNSDSIQNSSNDKYGEGFSDQIMIIGERQPFTMSFILGDPDTGEALQYKQFQAYQ